MLNKTHVIKKQSYVQLLLWKQEIPWFFDVERNVSIGKKTEYDEFII